MFCILNRTFGVLSTRSADSDRQSLDVLEDVRLSSLTLNEGFSTSRKFFLKSGMCMAGSLAIMSLRTEREPVLNVETGSTGSVAVVFADSEKTSRFIGGLTGPLSASLLLFGRSTHSSGPWAGEPPRRGTPPPDGGSAGNILRVLASI